MSDDREDWDLLRDLVIPLAIIAMVVTVAAIVGGSAIFNP